MVKSHHHNRGPLARAFTLIELIVVIIILTILTFLAVASYATVSNDLSADTAKGYVAQVVSAEVQYSSNNGVYADDPSILTGLQKGITVTTDNVTDTGQVSIAIDASTNRLGLAAMDQSGNCILEVADAAIEGAPTQSVPFVTGDPCNGNSALTTSTPNQVVDKSQTYDTILKTYSPTGWWKLSDSISASTAADNADGAAYPGSVNGTVTFGQSGGPGSPDDAAALFAGNADVTTGLNPSGYSALTLSAWVNLDGATPSGTESLVGDTSSSGDGLSLSLAGSDGLDPSVTIDTTNGPTTLLSDQEITNDSWYNVAATYDGSTLTIYVNGYPTAFTSVTGNIVASKGLIIGQNGNNNFYTNATLAQVALFNTAISPDNMASLYESAYTPATIEALTVTGVTPAANSALVTWTDPDVPAGLTGYIVTASPGGLTCSTVSALSCTVDGLTSGVSYTFTVQQDTATGLGTTSAPSSSIADTITDPAAPTDIAAQTTTSTADVTWAAPVNNGGSPILSYELQYAASPFVTWNVAATNISSTSYTITGLTPGTSYEFEVAATNAQGQSPYETTATAQVNAGVPGAPRTLSATATNAAIDVSWSAPASSGGSAITSYVATAEPGNFSCSTTGALSCNITGLTNATSYTISVVAINEIGTSTPAVFSTSVTPYTVPTAPLSPVGTPGPNSATIDWTAPTSNGGSAITLYTVTSSPGGFTCTSVTSLSCTITGLTNTVAYTFTVTAANAAGSGPSSVSSASVTPAPLPGAPSGVSASNINNIAYNSPSEATISWSPPVANGSGTITGYTATSSPGSLLCTTSGTTSCIIQGLTAGTSYTFSVVATSSEGTGPAASSASFVPATVPQAPQSPLLGATTSTTAAISWSAGASGGSSITGYTVTSTPGSLTCTTSVLTCTVTGLTAGTTYSFNVTATSAAGTSTNSSTVAESGSTPSAPQNPVATPNDGSATVSWTAPASNGGATISLYTVTSTPGSYTCTTSVLTCTVTGLTDGTSYTFAIAATNANGTGPSATTSAVSPYSAPGAPTGLGASAGNALANLTWTAPVSNGGSSLIGYEISYSTNAGSTWILITANTNSTTTSYQATGLTNGTSYIFEVAALSADGPGPYSSASSAVVPTTTPGAPTAVAATPGSSQASVSWSAPSSTGGSPITGYTATSSPGSFTCSATVPTCIVTGLTNGTSYTFTVTATNAQGTGPASAASTPVTPEPAVPGAPTGVTATSSAATTLTISWSAPGYIGSSSITLYTVTSSPGGYTCTSSGLTCVVTGLSDTQSYTFTVTATNAQGTGPSSTSSASYAPYPAPGAPTGVSATPGNAQATVSWSTPASSINVTGYTVTSSPGGLTCTTSTLTCTVSGLTNNTSYSFTVTAANAAGTGAASTPSSAVTPVAYTVASAPTGASATPGVNAATIYWSTPSSNGGATITGYTVTSSPGSFTCTTTGALTCTVSGLTNGTSYTFSVTATNSVGIGPASSPSSAVTSGGTSNFAWTGSVQTFTVPTNVYSINTTINGAGGGGGDISGGTGIGGGAGGQVSGSIAVTPGEVLTLIVGAGGTTSSNISDVGGGSMTQVAGGGGWSGLFQSTTLLGLAGGGGGGGAFYSNPGGLGGNGGGTTGSPGGSGTNSITCTGGSGGTQSGGGTGGTCAGSSSNYPGATGATNPTNTGTGGLGGTGGDGYAGGGGGGYYGGGGGGYSASPYNPTGGGGGGASYISGTLTSTAGAGGSAGYYGGAAGGNGTILISYAPSVVPTAPQSVAATAGPGSATVTWTAPVTNGGSTITLYTVTASDTTNSGNGGETCTSSSTTCTDSGLTPGDSYTFSVTATNSVGSGPASPASNAITPTALTVPSAPQSAAATITPSGATITWTAPTSNGGATITLYTATSSPGGLTCTAATTAGCTITGLTGLTSYTFSVTATNSLGTGPTSSPSNSVTAYTSTSYSYTGSTQTYTVPSGITSIYVTLYGAQGGYQSQYGGGQGGEVTGYLSVTGGQVLTVKVGGSPETTTVTGGYGGGGNGGSGEYGGGGATSIINSSSVYLAEAAGGGGTGNPSCAASGGAGGGLTGTAGGNTGATGGAGGTQSAGGAGGAGTQGGGNGTAGSSQQGGTGGTGSGTGSTCTVGFGGTGGGGGYYGGGGGGGGGGPSYYLAAGGGGGASLVPSGGTTTPGVNENNGSAVVSYN